MTNLPVEFHIQPHPASISLVCPTHPHLCVHNAAFTLQYRCGGAVYDEPLEITGSLAAGVEEMQQQKLPFALETVETYTFQTSHGCIRGSIHTARDVNQQFLCLKIALQNHCRSDIQLQRIGLINAGSLDPFKKGKVSFSLEDERQDLAFFSNGWQSWSYSAVYGALQRQPASKLWFIPNAASTNPSTPHFKARGHFSGDFFGVLGNRRTRLGLLAGFLSQAEQFGSLEVDLRSETGLKVWANGDDALIQPGGSMETDWLVLSWIDLDDPDGLQPYYQQVAALHGLKPPDVIPTGWCSWYHFYTAIDENKIQKNVQRLEELRCELPLGLIQIDDGFQAAGGDWFHFSEGFPNGVAPLAKTIQQSGFTPGLWLAPFIVSRGARIAREHPEFLLKNRAGMPVNAGFISNKLSMALDISFPPALDYACKVVGEAAREWGFGYLKLDFLYAGALPGQRRDGARTRAQILRHGLQKIRESAGEETMLLGCGLPLGSGLGLVEAMRIGADTGGSWKPKLFGFPLVFRDDPQLPCTRNAIQNTLSRVGMHRRWWINDPDCLLVRSQTELTDEEVRSHATLIGLTGGSLLLSDDLTRLPAERRRIAACLLPLIGQRPQVMDWFDQHTPQRLRLDLASPAGNWHLIAFFNWGDRPAYAVLSRKEFGLAEKPFWVRSFWENRLETSAETDPLWQQNVPAHGVIVLAVRERLGETQYLGSDLHLSQGLEVHSWMTSPGYALLRLELGRSEKGFIDLHLPEEPKKIVSQGAGTSSNILPGVYRLPVQVENHLQVEIDYR